MGGGGTEDAAAGREVFPEAGRPPVPSPGRTGTGGYAACARAGADGLTANNCGAQAAAAGMLPCYRRVAPTLWLWGCDGRPRVAPPPGIGGVYCAGTPGLAWEWLDGGVLTWATCDGARTVAWAFAALPPRLAAERAPVAAETVLATVSGRATHYGESYQSQTMGCGGVYDTADATIVAVSPDRYASWPCGIIFPPSTLLPPPFHRLP